MSARRPTSPPAKSNYGQVRLTVTYEVGGHASWRLLSKPYTEDWKELHVVAQGRERLTEFPRSFDDALAVMAEILMGQGPWSSR